MPGKGYKKPSHLSGADWLNPLKVKKSLAVDNQANPIQAYRDAGKRGGNQIDALFDPSGKFLKQPTKTAKEYAKEKEERRKAGQKMMSSIYGMKSGGQAKMACGGKAKKMAKGGQCRGMGAASRGGKFSKSG